MQKNKNLDRYQGELRSKCQAMNDFLEYNGEPDKHGGYDTKKISEVLNVIQKACISIATERERATLVGRAR
ncbi:hypothetical protein PsAD26_01822 [Pseudovibrio sp. Ad26]|nr:hypothetical protein PsAD26_01822 [Pseudovibrio sp. Ad26]